MVKLRRKEKRRINNERYSIGDFFLDLLLWVPELLLLPIRLLFLGIRLIVRWIVDFF
ncbi:hypothetical protein QYG89_15745 [Bacillus sp. B190/17]|uniref:Uncharacterized protein n=1 Tax=Bacillus lumedeiriae TaxID=3058829 RepID=A0ABW8IC61_9BACI